MTRPHNGGHHGRFNMVLPAYMLEEMKREAKRLDLSLSHVVRIAWKLAKRSGKMGPGGLMSR